MPKGDSAHKLTEQKLALADVLHGRARESATEQRKLITSLATGALAVFFIGVTGKIDPPLSGRQQAVLLAALLVMGLSVFASLLSWYADGRRNYFRATGFKTADGERRRRLFALHQRWYRSMKVAGYTQAAAFASGVALASVYMVARILAW